MIDKELLRILVCPKSHRPLLPADKSLLAAVNARIGRGEVNNVGGGAVTEPLQDGLVRDDRAVLYPVVDGIPVLLVEEGIPLAAGR